MSSSAKEMIGALASFDGWRCSIASAQNSHPFSSTCADATALPTNSAASKNLVTTCPTSLAWIRGRFKTVGCCANCLHYADATRVFDRMTERFEGWLHRKRTVFEKQLIGQPLVMNAWSVDGIDRRVAFVQYSEQHLEGSRNNAGSTRSASRYGDAPLA